MLRTSTFYKKVIFRSPPDRKNDITRRVVKRAKHSVLFEHLRTNASKVIEFQKTVAVLQRPSSIQFVYSKGLCYIVIVFLYLEINEAMIRVQYASVCLELFHAALNNLRYGRCVTSFSMQLNILYEGNYAKK